MKANEIEPGVMVGDYRAENGESLLAFLDKLSEARKDGGIFHGGHIYYIQNKLSEEDDMCFLKACISLILDEVPSVFPLDLPEQVDGGKLTEVPEAMSAKMAEIQSKLILPMSSYDVVRVIKAAREYIDLDKPGAN